MVLSGDVILPELGLSEEDKTCLIDDVSVVFYCSALLKMNASLKRAVDANALGVIRALELAQKMKHLIVSFSVFTILPVFFFSRLDG